MASAFSARPLTETQELRRDCLQHGKKLSQVADKWIKKADEAQREVSQNWRLFPAIAQAQRDYERDFRYRTVRLFELAEQRGLAEPRWKVRAQNAGKDPWAMKRVAEELIRIGRET